MPPGTERVADQAGALPVLLDAARQIFGRPVDPKDNFFDLGGSSLAALRLIALVTASGYWLRIEDVFDLPDLATLAASATSNPASSSTY